MILFKKMRMHYILKNRNLSLLFIASGLFFFNEMILMPTLPLYLSNLGYSHLALGSVLGAFALGVLALRPVAGLVTGGRARRCRGRPVCLPGRQL